MAMQNYDPNEVYVNVKKPDDERWIRITGLAEGTFVTCEKEEDNYQTVAGADGLITRTRIHNNLGNITITLKNTSPGNSVLNGLAKSRSIISIQVNDKNKDQKVKAGGDEGWILKPAAHSRGADVENVEWNIQVADYYQNYDVSVL